MLSADNVVERDEGRDVGVVFCNGRNEVGKVERDGLRREVVSVDAGGAANDAKRAESGPGFLVRTVSGVRRVAGVRRCSTMLRGERGRVSSLVNVWVDLNLWS